jgi:hypothetical protein
MSVAMPEGTTGWPMERMASLKSSLSSALSMARMSEPSRRTPCFSSQPSFESCMAMVRPVWPPSPASRLSGCSFSIMRFMVSAFSGSRYISSARCLSVMMVAGFEFASTTFTPSAFKTPQACAPA